MTQHRAERIAPLPNHLQRDENVRATAVSNIASDPLVSVLGSASDASGHASILRSATTSGSSQPVLLQLQRQFGNRYVQRIVALASQGKSREDVHPSVESAIEGARGGGQPLDRSVRRQMESVFGADFGGVRVHTGHRSDTLNRAVNAEAFTTGQDIFFSEGSYKPASSAGQELLAHELAHVVQQSGPPVKFKLQVNEPGDVYEQEADAMAAAVRKLDAGSSLTETHGPSPGGGPALHRKCACGGSGESQGECAECATKRKARLKAKRKARTQVVAPQAHTSGADPFTQALVQNRFAGLVDKAVIRSNDPSGSRTSTLDFGAKPRKSAEMDTRQEKERARTAQDAPNQGGLILNADVKVERPTYTSRQAALTDQGAASAQDSDDDVVRLGQADEDTDTTSATDSSSDSVSGTDNSSQNTSASTDQSSSDSTSQSTSESTSDQGDNGAERVAQVGSCTYQITYANIRNTGCGAGKCGAQIMYDVTQACGTGTGCPPIDGKRVTESVTTDNGCGPGTVTTGAGCPIRSHAPYLPTCGEISGCTDTYGLCASAAYFPAAGCTERYTQQIFVGGTLAETHTITFTITQAGGACSGTVSRS